MHKVLTIQSDQTTFSVDRDGIPEKVTQPPPASCFRQVAACRVHFLCDVTLALQSEYEKSRIEVEKRKKKFVFRLSPVNTTYHGNRF